MENIRGFLSVISLVCLPEGPVLWLVAFSQCKPHEAAFRLISTQRIGAVKNHLYQKSRQLYYMACIVFAVGIISGLIL